MSMEVDDEVPAAAAASSTPSVEKGGKKRFEVKKWNAVALWAWDIVVDNCAICRNHIMDLCIECQVNQVQCFRHHYDSKSGEKMNLCKYLKYLIFIVLHRHPRRVRSARWRGAFAITPFISIVFLDG